MKKYLMSLSAIIPFLAAEVILSIVMEVLKVWIGCVDTETLDGEAQRQLSYVCSVIAVTVCTAIFLLWYRIETKGESGGKIRKLLLCWNIPLFLLLAVGCQFFCTGILGLISPYLKGIFQDYSVVLEQITSGSPVLVFVFTVILAPVAEELIFRGMVMHKAKGYLPFWAANIMQSLLFGLYHGNVIQGIYAALLGYLLGMICNKYQTIVAAILLHALINASAYLVFLIPETTSWYLLITALSMVLVPGALAGMKLSLQNNTNE